MKSLAKSEAFLFYGRNQLIVSICYGFLFFIFETLLVLEKTIYLQNTTFVQIFT